MKASNYNFIFKVEDSEDKIMYNSMTNSLAIIDNDGYSNFKNFYMNNLEIKDKELFRDLKRGGFIIDEEFDELNELKNRLWRGRYSSESLYLTIAPTSDCNFRCGYCYEKDVLTDCYMKEDVEQAIINLVKNYSSKINRLSVIWYGGEPLLALDTIKKLSEEFIDICKKNSIEYNANIVTNGYLLNRNTIILLNKLKVSFYQITIDGFKESHDIRRPHKDGTGTFDTIFDNIIQNIDVIPNIGLRTNIDRTNYNAGVEISKLIRENNIESKVKVYLGKVTNDSNDSDLRINCLNTKEFIEKDLEHMKKTENPNWLSKYPMIKLNYCGADSANSFVVNSDGEIYKCWNDIGIKNRTIGNILNNDRVNHKIYFDYLLFDPTEDKKCSKCKVLPICMGGCPFYRMQGNMENSCSIYKTSIKEYITNISKQLSIDVNESYEKASNI